MHVSGHLADLCALAVDMAGADLYFFVLSGKGLPRSLNYTINTDLDILLLHPQKISG